MLENWNLYNDLKYKFYLIECKWIFYSLGKFKMFIYIKKVLGENKSIDRESKVIVLGN